MSPDEILKLCGWGVWRSPTDFDHVATQQVIREAFDLWGDDIQAKFHVVGAEPYKVGRRSMLWEIARKTLKQDTPNYCQQVGDCVGFAAKNAIEYVQLFPMTKDPESVWTPVFPPYLWGCGRLFIGNNQLGTRDGSIGAWQAKAVMKYGTIRSNEEDVPPYSDKVARQWGNSPGPNKKWIEIGKKHIVKSTALVNSWQDMVQALCNGYPVTIASTVGFDMLPQKDGFHHHSTKWPHAMCIIGVDDDGVLPHACVLNEWGDAHGEIKDFKTGQVWPKGTLRVRKEDILEILGEGDSFAYSAFDGFFAQEVDKDKFDLW